MEKYEKERIERVLSHLGLDQAQSVEDVDLLLNRISFKDLRLICLIYRCTIQNVSKRLFKVRGNAKKIKNISRHKDERMDKAAAIALD